MSELERDAVERGQSERGAVEVERGAGEVERSESELKHSAPEHGELERVAQRLRCDIVSMITEAGSGHPGGSLSAVELMCALWFGGILNWRAGEPLWEGRDRFILSKGHAAPLLYATLAEAGYLERAELATLRKLGSRLQGHPDMRKLPGVEASTGSLGQGLSLAVGMALGLALGGGTQRVYCLLGDGECQEGQVWEAALYAAHRKTSNLIALIDNNELQIDGHVSDICDVGNLAQKFANFGWQTLEVDGHSLEALGAALRAARDSAFEGPRLIVAHTTKGKGVPFMENQCGWHGKAPSAEQCAAALEGLALGGSALEELASDKLTTDKLTPAKPAAEESEEVRL